MSFSPSLYLVADHLIVANGGWGIVIMVEARRCSGNNGGWGIVIMIEGRRCGDNDGGEGVWWKWWRGGGTVVLMERRGMAVKLS